jgi:hypothetical protein
MYATERGKLPPHVCMIFHGIIIVTEVDCHATEKFRWEGIGCDNNARKHDVILGEIENNDRVVE